MLYPLLLTRLKATRSNKCITIFNDSVQDYANCNYFSFNHGSCAYGSSFPIRNSWNLSSKWEFVVKTNETSWLVCNFHLDRATLINILPSFDWESDNPHQTVLTLGVFMKDLLVEELFFFFFLAGNQRWWDVFLRLEFSNKLPGVSLSVYRIVALRKSEQLISPEDRIIFFISSSSA